MDFLATLIALICIVVPAGLYIWVQSLKEPSVEEEPIEESEEEMELKPFDAKLTETYLTLDNYIGQDKNVDYIRGHIEIAKQKGTALPHILLWGPGGLGKSTLMKAVANEMGGRFIEVVPANLRTINDLFMVLFEKVCTVCSGVNHFSVRKCMYCKSQLVHTFYPRVKLEPKDILFLEECHGLKQDIEEALYSLMQDGYMILRFLGQDNRVEFPPITVSGATTQLGDLKKPFRDRFKITVKLNPYTKEEIMEIIRQYCKHKKYKITQNAVERIAELSFGVPRIAKKFIEDARTKSKKITIKSVEAIRNLLDIDENGLDEIHRKILEYIHIRKAAGETSIANAVQIPRKVYKEVYEPALVYKDLITFSSRGRILTPKAKELYFADKL